MELLGVRQQAPAAGAAGRGGLRARESLLSMYAEAPTEEVTLLDFEVLALNRLRLLKAIETAKARGAKPREVDDEIRRQSVALLGGDIGAALEPDPVAQRTDSVSHHILRLAYCQSDDKRKWFLAQESQLFEYRVRAQTTEQFADFMRRNGLSFTPVDEEERERLAPQLAAVHEASRALTAPDGATPGAPGSADPPFSALRFYRVPWLQAQELVRSRRVLLRGGLAYVPSDRLHSLVLGRFRAALSRGLVAAFRALPAVLRDERVAPVLTHVSEAYLGSDDFGRGGRGGDVGGADDKLSPRDVDDLARSAMPLCMSALHTALKERHHLKHGGRMQYGLYLKGAGLGLEDALAFWQAEFSASMSAEDFLKRYAYNIRHNYGKEGRRADYRPYHCQKIIMGSPPGVGEVHGCPYRHWDEPHLRAALARSGLGGAAVEDVLGSVRTHDYQLACRKQWEARFGCRADDVGNHPNVYTREARLALRGQHPAQSATVRDAAAKAAAAAAAAAAASSTTTTTGAPAEAGATAGAGAGSDAGEPRSDAPASPQGGGAAPHGGAALVTPPPALPAGRGLGLEP